MSERPKKTTDSIQDRPPVFKSWSRVYAAVLLNLAVHIILFYLFTLAFR